MNHLQSTISSRLIVLLVAFTFISCTTIPLLAQTIPTASTRSTVSGQHSHNEHHRPGSEHSSNSSANSSRSTTSTSTNTSSTGTHSYQLNLNLSSTLHSILVGQQHQFQPVTILVGSSDLTLNPGTRITPAEQLAMMQVLHTGQQSLILSATGNAIGGSFNLTPLALRAINNLVIPSSVTAIDNVSKISVLNISGNLINSGTIEAISTNPQSTTASISALNILNNPGASITTLSSTGSNSILNLNLTALQNIVNQGSIISSGTLTATAGGSISNALQGQVTGTPPVMQALSTVNLYSGAGSITNHGLISSLAGNINIASQLTQDIVINNTGGTLAASNGAINVRNSSYSNQANLSILGGDLISKELNLYSGLGNINLNAQNLSGLLNLYAGQANIEVATNTLSLGTIQLSGDPTFYNTTGSVVINSTLSFPGQNLAIVASGDITTAAGAGIIDTSSTTGDGGQILLVAGAQFTSSGSNSALPPPPGDTTSTLTITGASATGGNIDLSSGTPITTFTSNTTAHGSNGGNVTLIAFSNGTAGTGTISLPSTTVINASGKDSGQNGNVTIIAGAPSGTALNLGSIHTFDGTGGGGIISISGATPTISGGSVLIQNGGYAPGSGTFTIGTVQSTTLNFNAAVGGLFDPTAGVIGNSVTINGGTISSQTGNISVTSTRGAVTINGNIDISSGTGSAGTVYLSSSGGDLTTEDITANGLGPNNSGGTIYLYSSHTISTGDIAANGISGASGGAILAFANDISVSTISATADGAGSGGSILAYANSNFLATGVDAFGASLNVSSVGQNGGLVDIYTESKNDFFIGNVGSHANGIAGDVLATGGNIGGTVQLVCCGRQAFNGGTIDVSGGTKNGEVIFLNCENQPVNPIVIRHNTKTAGVTKAAALQVHRISTDVTMVPASDNPFDDPDIGDGSISSSRDQQTNINAARITARNLNSQQIAALSKRGVQILESVSVRDTQRSNSNTTSHFILNKGNVLFEPPADIVVHTHDGNVLIAAHSMVFVMETGNDVAVYDLHDGHNNGVKVEAQGKTINLLPGRQVLLTRKKDPEFKKVNPAHKIAFKNVENYELDQSMTAYTADFSILSAMIAVKPLKQILDSDDPHDVRAASQLIKNAVILADISDSTETFKTLEEGIDTE